MGLAGEGSGLTTVPPQAVPGDSTPVEKPLPFNYSCQTLTGAVHPVSRGGRFYGRPPAVPGQDSYLVDSASSHMLVSKIKQCMSKYKQLYGETANGSLNQLSFI